MSGEPPEAAPVGISLTRRVASAAGWNFLATLSERLVAFAVFVEIVRHIAPSAIGVVTLASVFIDMTLILAEGGLQDTLIRHPNPTTLTFSTAFWTNLGLGLVLTLIVAVAAYPLAAFYHEPKLVPVMDALSLAFVLSALSVVPLTRLLRDFGYRGLAYRSMAATFIGGLAALVAAHFGYGIWALVAQRLVTAAISTIWLWLAVRWWPRWQFSPTEFRELMWFGLKVTGSMLCHQLTGTIVIMVLGAFCGTAAVGFFRVAQRLFDVVTQFTIMPLLKVALSSFSQVQSEPRRFADTYLRMTGAISMVGIGAFLGLGALAGPTIELVFGPEWLPSARLLTIMSISAIPMCCVVFLWPALTARGRPGQLQMFGIVEVVTSGVFAAIAAPWGVGAVAVAQVLRAFALAPYALWLTARICGVAPGAVLRELLAPSLSALIMAAALVPLAARQGADGMGNIGIIAIDAPLGIALFGLAMLILAPQKAAMLHGLLRRRLAARVTPSPL